MRRQSMRHHNALVAQREGSWSSVLEHDAAVQASKKTRESKKPPQRELEFGDGFADAGSGAAPSDPTGGREAADALYLSNTNCCSDSAVIGPEVQPNRTFYVLKPCMCRKWYCNDCAPVMGRSLRRRLRDRLKEFKRVFGITLTLDGSLFSSPEEGWRYVMDKRLLSLLVKKLFNAGFLKSRDYFWILEWQEETQQAHWHLLVDSDFVPYGYIVEIWSSFRPRWAPALEKKVTADNYKDLERPAFGSVRFSLPEPVEAWKAAWYATKYLVKTPEYGFPDWVLDYVGRVPRYGSSRGFFPNGKSTDRNSAEREPSFDPHRLEREPKTLRDRIDQCKQQTTVLRVVVMEEEGGERLESRPQFSQTLKVPFSEVCHELRVSPEDCRSIRVTFDAILRLWLLESQGSKGSRCADEVMEDDW